MAIRRPGGALVASAMALLGAARVGRRRSARSTARAGQSAEHERMTRAALACPSGMKSDDTCFEPATIAQLAGRTGTFGAVGQPDIPPPEGPPSHCDDADYLDTGSYPISRAAATATLDAVHHATCRRSSPRAGSARAGSSSTAATSSTRRRSRSSPDCVFAGNGGQRAKCDVIYYLGRALHGVQDFYAHSNWSDEAAPGATGRDNPPGLNRASLPPFLDLRHISLSLSVPAGLSTGCFNIEELTGGSDLLLPPARAPSRPQQGQGPDRSGDRGDERADDGARARRVELREGGRGRDRRHAPPVGGPAQPDPQRLRARGAAGSWSARSRTTIRSRTARAATSRSSSTPRARTPTPTPASCASSPASSSTRASRPRRRPAPTRARTAARSSTSTPRPRSSRRSPTRAPRRSPASTRRAGRTSAAASRRRSAY